MVSVVIPGQSVNLAHLIWRKPCAPVPLLLTEAQGVPPVVAHAGLLVLVEGVVQLEAGC